MDGILYNRDTPLMYLAVAVVTFSLVLSPATIFAADEPAGSGGGSDLEEPAFVPPEPDDASADARHAEPGTVHPDGAVELSIKPRAEVGSVAVQVLADSPRPEWVEMDKEVTKAGAIRYTVSSGPHSRMREARLALEAEAQQTAAAHMDDQLGVRNAARWLRLFVGEKYDLKKLASRHAILDPEYAAVEGSIQPLYKEQLVVSVGPMHQWYTRLEFDENFHRQLDSDWQKVTAISRLLQFGLSAAGILGMLATMLGFFKANTATRGAHTRRLLVTGVVVVSALIAAAVLAARWLPWI